MVQGHMQELLDEELPPRRRPGGSSVERSPNFQRNRIEMDERMFKDYSKIPVFGPVYFRKRYQMWRSIFLTIMERLCVHDNYFIQKRNAVGVLGLSPRQKISAALCMLAYGVCADAVDEYCRVSESIAMECMKRFCAAVQAKFGNYHMRQPTRADFETQLAINAACGFPGMLALLDCMHYEWKNCLVAWQGDFGNRDGKKLIILETVADRGLHIWHIFFGLAGSNNYINVLDQLSLVHNLLTGAACDMTFEVNGQEYNRYYLLADVIYPQWSCFIQSIHMPGDEKWAHFAKCQEACRKDVEQCFGVLQSCFAIIHNPCRHWDMDTISDIIFACCILHNMILDDERGVLRLENVLIESECANVALQRDQSFEELVISTVELENRDSFCPVRRPH